MRQPTPATPRVDGALGWPSWRRSAIRACALWTACGASLGCSSDTTSPIAPETDAGIEAPDARPDGSSNGTPDAAPPDASPTENSDVTPAPDGEPYDTLAEWNLFADTRAQVPNDRVIPYEVNARLFSDFAAKKRFLWVPDGETIGYASDGPWRFPTGAILVKTFLYPEDLREPEGPARLLETRLLVRRADGWVPHTYVWNEEQTRAERTVAGDILDTSFVGLDGEPMDNAYVVPNTNECKECHGKPAETLGGKTRQLNRDFGYETGTENQIDHLAALGLLDAEPEPADARQTLVDPEGSAPLFERVRAYFDANCGHCHNPGDSNDNGSGLWLAYENTDPATGAPQSWGICKQPTSAGGATCGHTFDIVPGEPDSSILICRLESTESKVVMPPLGRTLQHDSGIQLMREWIESLDGTCGE